jgi:hypothetical protein
MSTLTVEELIDALGKPTNGFLWRLIDPTPREYGVVRRAEEVGLVDFFDLTTDSGDEHGIPGSVFRHREVNIAVHLLRKAS